MHKQIRFALEPEAASIWCQVLTDEEVLKLSAVGTQYMVVDLGGKPCVIICRCSRINRRIN